MALILTRQIKAARALVGWGQYELALQAGVAISTIRRLESLDGRIAAQVGTLEKIKNALERAGIEFQGAPSPGVRIKAELVSNIEILKPAQDCGVR